MPSHVGKTSQKVGDNFGPVVADLLNTDVMLPEKWPVKDSMWLILRNLLLIQVLDINFLLKCNVHYDKLLVAVHVL